MKWISTTIKKKWINKILSGEKKVEYKNKSEYWQKRLEKISAIDIKNGVGINFLCGQEAYKFKVIKIDSITSETPKNIDGVECHSWYEIHLGERISINAAIKENHDSATIPDTT